MANNYLDFPGYPLGLRNNNPGNLRPLASGQKWNGEIAADYVHNFSRFQDVGFGLRAMITDITGDIVNDGRNTIRKLVTAYAPPNENNTIAYINAVASKVGISPDAVIDPTRAMIEKIIRAKLTVELGPGYAPKITSNDISEGFARLSDQVKGWITGNGAGMAGSGAITLLIGVGLAVYLFRNELAGNRA